MRYFYSFLFGVLFSTSNLAQIYDDYLGAGHTQGITVTSSSQMGDAPAINTINGKGLDAKLLEASRFLAQATLGADRAQIQQVVDMGMESWIDNQMNISPTYITPLVNSITQEIRDLWEDNGLDLEDFFGPWAVHFNYAWWQANMTNQDLLRQRVALALSEILVISYNSELVDWGEALGSYYDLLLNHTFGNYEDLLNAVSLHPCMASYLSHLNNPKTDVIDNIRPDQNYAREVMQLFSIGLYALNPDGSRQLDENGEFIPTYNNTHIEEMSKVFTGLMGSDIEPWVDWTDSPYFGLDFWGINKIQPLMMYEPQHEPGPKYLMNDFVVNPNGTNTGIQDIESAISFLFNHDNTAPFISYRLIQRLVKSNPSPAYVARISSVFGDNGNGVRGDLGAVVKAILLDEEARECVYQKDPDNGKLREPILRFTHVSRALPKDSPLGRYWNNGFDYLESTKQHPMGAPSVFNFFPPDYQPIGDITDNNLVAPEYKLHDSQSSIGYINKVNQWAVWDALWWSWEGDLGDPIVTLMLTELESVADHPETLINELDILFTHGTLSDGTRAIIKEAVSEQIWGNYQYDRVRLALYLILISPDYNVFR